MVAEIRPAASMDAEVRQFPSGPPATPRDIPFLEDATVDQLLRAIVTLTMELSVTRDRLRSLELVLTRDDRGISEEIDQLSVASTEDADRRSERERLIASILGPLLNTP